MTGGERYRSIVDHYEACLEKHGDSHLGVDWPNPKDGCFEGNDGAATLFLYRAAENREFLVAQLSARAPGYLRTKAGK